jgi:hypothetical protein
MTAAPFHGPTHTLSNGHGWFVTQELLDLAARQRNVPMRLADQMEILPVEAGGA